MIGLKVLFVLKSQEPNSDKKKREQTEKEKRKQVNDEIQIQREERKEIALRERTKLALSPFPSWDPGKEEKRGGQQVGE